MTLHGPALSIAADQSLPEVPGLAYYTAQASKPAQGKRMQKRSPMAEALDLMYGYYRSQD